MKSQTDRILARLKAGRTINSMQALRDFGCFRLAARINDLRNDGFEVQSQIVKKGEKRYAEYWL